MEALGQTQTKRKVTATIEVKGKGEVEVVVFPDFIDDTEGIVGEIKNGANIGYTPQIRTQIAYADNEGYVYILYINRNASLHPELVNLERRGEIEIKYIDDLIQP